MKVVTFSLQDDDRAVDLYEECGAISATLYKDNQYFIHGLEDIEYLQQQGRKS